MISTAFVCYCRAGSGIGSVAAGGCVANAAGTKTHLTPQRMSQLTFRTHDAMPCGAACARAVIAAGLSDD
jgi:hypothetical protein